MQQHKEEEIRMGRWPLGRWPRLYTPPTPEQRTTSATHRHSGEPFGSSDSRARMLHRTLLEMQQDLLLTQTELFQGLSHQVAVATELEQDAWTQVEELKQTLIETQFALERTEKELYKQKTQNQQLAAYVLDLETMYGRV